MIFLGLIGPVDEGVLMWDSSLKSCADSMVIGWKYVDLSYIKVSWFLKTDGCNFGIYWDTRWAPSPVISEVMGTL